MRETEGRQDEGEKGPVKHPHPKTVSKTQDETESTDFTAIIRKIDKHSLKHYSEDDDYLKALPK